MALGKTRITTNATVGSGQPLSALTNGNNQPSDYISLSPGPAWVQLDLEQVYLISRIQTWRYWGDQRTYRDVILQISENGSSWTTRFNNDRDNTSGQGQGSDAEFAET